MVEKEQIVSAYRNYKGTFIDEIDELNKALREMDINCEVMSQENEDGETLIFKKVDL